MPVRKQPVVQPQQGEYLVMSSCRRVENWEGKKPGKYLCMKPKMSTCPTGVRGAIRIMVNGTNIRRSHAVRRSAWTSLGFKVWPALLASLVSYIVQDIKHFIPFIIVECAKRFIPFNIVYCAKRFVPFSLMLSQQSSARQAIGI